MAGIGVLVDDGINQGYAYKIKVPAGASSGGIVDLSQGPGAEVKTFLELYQKYCLQDGIEITGVYASGQLIGKTVGTEYTVAYTYTLGQLTEKTISKTSGGWAKYTYTYDGSGNWSNTNITGGN